MRLLLAREVMRDIDMPARMAQVGPRDSCSPLAHGAGSEQFVERMPKGSLLPERSKGGHCPRCRSPLKVFKVGGRTVFCCPRCQRC